MTATNRRSEAVRARRSGSKKSKNRRKKASRKLSMRQAPPMVSRGGMVRPPQSNRSRKSARKRYSVPLSSLGAEINLPAVPQIHVGWRLISGLMILGLGWALYAVWSAPYFTVSEAEISGLERISQVEINTIIKVAGSSIFTVDPDAIESRLQEVYPELTEIHITASFPAKVSIEAGERVPILAWEQAGVTAWVDPNGVAFLPRGTVEDLISVQAVDAPLVDLEEEGPARLLSPEMVQAIQTLSGYVPNGTQLLYDSQRGLGWVDPEYNWQVYFGPKPEEMDSRLALYNAIAAYLVENNNLPSLISVENLHAPYFRFGQ